MNQVLKKILIKTKKQVFTEIIGNNISSQKGEGYDFAELKEYEYGEDVKNIDWVISAKLQKPYVKVFHAQKELNIKLVSILNGSTYFGTTKFKQELITQIAAALAFICVKQGDPFSSYIANEELIVCTKKSKKSFNVQFMSEHLFNYNVIGKDIHYKHIIQELYKSIHHKSIIFLIGDFFNTETIDFKLLSKKHEVVVIIVRDKFEENPVALGNVNLNDPSSNINFEGQINNNTISNYVKKIHESDHKLYNHLKDCAIRFTKIYTHEDPVKKIIGLLK